MEKFSSFIETTRDAAQRGKPYFVNSPSKTQAHWPVGKGEMNIRLIAEPQRSLLAEAKFFEDQIPLILTNHYRFLGVTPGRKSIARRTQVLSSFYRALKEKGFDIKDVTTFGLRHAKALLEIWTTKNCNPRTIYVRWSELRSWSIALGKQGMLGPLKEYLPDCNPLSGTPSRASMFSKSQIQSRSDFLLTKPDLTPYLVDRLTRELGITRELALELEIDSVLEVVEGDQTFLRVGQGNLRMHIPHARLHLPLLLQVRDFMLQRNRKTLAWTGLDLDAALQKYSLRMSYVNRTVLRKETVDAPHQKNGGAA